MRRVLKPVTVLLFLAPAGLAGASGNGDAGAGADLYEADCAECHEVAADVAAAVPGDGAADRSGFLDGFLAQHFAPDDQNRADLIAYLLSLSE